MVIIGLKSKNTSIVEQLDHIVPAGDDNDSGPARIEGTERVQLKGFFDHDFACR
jgi:hypothetical protein